MTWLFLGLFNYLVDRVAVLGTMPLGTGGFQVIQGHLHCSGLVAPLFRHFAAEAHIFQRQVQTETAAEIIAVVKIDGRTIGDGKPGEVTKSLRSAFRKLVESEG